VEHKTWTTIDKTSWPDGPWQSEPDKEQWEDDATGLPCLLKRHPHGGHLCGYVGVPEGHPWYARTDEEMGYPDVHGGITYADVCDDEGDEATSICHVTETGEKVWWLGFDMAHAFDLQPAMIRYYEEHDLRPSHIDGETYRDVPYVKAECAKLAKQAQDAS